MWWCSNNALGKLAYQIVDEFMEIKQITRDKGTAARTYIFQR
jgi:hypothetical protein